MDHEILAWLNSEQDYPSGLFLYDRYCKNPNLGRILKVGGATGKNRLTLAYELGKAISHQVPHHSPEKAPDKPVPDKENLTVKIPAILIEDIRKEQKMIYKMLDSHHACLPFRDKEERRKIAFEILDLDDRLREIYTRINHYERTGVLLPKPEIIVKNNISGKDAGELIKRQYSVRTYLTRYKKLLEESDSLKDRDRYQKKLDEYQQEIEEINKKLGQ
ncbi:MAG: hypothetical protein NTX61_07635 [Bacteroidetes bacterium]|nr:hypothetical protein [Bacteroidota bacterium]